MADYYWKGSSGGTGTHSNVAANWMTTSGGSTAHTNAPGVGDNLFFDITATKICVFTGSNAIFNNLTVKSTFPNDLSIIVDSYTITLTGIATFDKYGVLKSDGGGILGFAGVNSAGTNSTIYDNAPFLIFGSQEPTLSGIFHSEFDRQNFTVAVDLLHMDNQDMILLDGIYPNVSFLNSQPTTAPGKTFKPSADPSAYGNIQYSEVDMLNFSCAIPIKPGGTTAGTPAFDDYNKTYRIRGTLTLTDPTFFWGNTTLRLTPTAAGQFLPANGESTTYGGTGPTFAAKYNRIIIDANTDFPNYYFTIRAGLKLFCNKLEIRSNARLYGSVQAVGTHTSGAEIHCVSSPVVHGDWNFSQISRGVYRNTGTIPLLSHLYGGTGLSSVGTAGQVLAVNNDADGLLWSSTAGGGGVTVENAGSALNTTATTLDFTGNGVTASGSGAEKTITITDTNTVYTHPNHSGDVTSSGDGATTIAADAVTYAKMQNVSATDRILGRDSAGAGVVEEISPSSLRTMINVADGANNYSHPTGAGNKHIPSGGASGNFLKYDSSGTAVWATPSYTTNTDEDVSVANLKTRLASDMGGAVTIGDSNDVVTIGNDLTITGDLIVSGTTTTLNTATVEVEDNILQLNTTQGSPDTATAATSGISVYRGNGVTQASLIFDEADDTWDLTNHLTVAGTITGNLTGNVTGNLTGNVTGNVSGTAATVTGAAQTNITSLGTLTALTGGTGDLIWDTNTLVVDSSANKVGIGTTSPEFKLDIRGEARILPGSGNFALRTGSNNEDIGIWRVDHNSTVANQGESNNSNYGFALKYLGTGTGDNNALVWLADALDGTQVQAMRLTQNGHLGIGTTSSSASDSGILATLHVESADEKLALFKSTDAGAGIQIDSPNDGYSVVFFSEGGTDKWSLGKLASNSDKFSIYDEVNNTPRLVIDTSGKVGIGTTSPQTPLHVVGNVMITNTNSDNTVKDSRILARTYTNNDYNLIYGYADATTNRLYLGGGTGTGEPATDIIFHTLALNADTDASGTERMRILANGNVGIGTATPTSLLHLANGSSDFEIDLDGSNAYLKGDYNMNYYADFDGSNSADYQNHKFFTDGTNERMRITSAGKVGIGTTTPGGLLDIHSTSGNQLRLSYNTDYYWILERDSNGKLNITNHQNATDVKAITIDTTERVGIGTSSPDYTLDVAGSIGVDDYIYHNGDDNTYILMQDDGIRLVVGNDLAFHYEEDSTSKLHLSYNGEADVDIGNGDFFFGGSQGSYDGRMGIGTTTPSHKLHVVGDIAALSPGQSGGVGFRLQNSEGEFFMYTDGGDLIIKDFAGSDTYPFKIEGTAQSDTLVVNTNGDVTIKDQLTIGSEIIHAGDTDTKIGFGTDTQTFTTGGSSRMDMSNSGLRLGGANSRVTTILDQDDMQSNSATALATQQSIKAYVDRVGGSAGGGTGTENGANTWCKILSWDPGTSQYRDLNLTLGITAVDVGSQNQAIINVYGRSNGTNSAHTMGIKVISLISASHLQDDSFKLITEGWGQPIELWMKKFGSYGTYNWSAIAQKVANNSTLTYSYNSAWQSTEPVKTNGTPAAATSYGTVIETRNPVLNLYHNHNVSSLSANDVLSTISFRKHTSHGGNETIRIYNVQGNSASPDYHTSDLRISTRTSGQNNFFDRFTILGQEGYVGIGTTTPTFPLDVNGWIATANGIVHTGDTNNTIQFDTDIQKFNTAGNTRMMIDTDGEIGIGTTTPRALLDVTATNNPTILLNARNAGYAADDKIGSLLFYNNEDSSGETGSRIGAGVRFVATDAYGRGRLELTAGTSNPMANYGEAENYTDNSIARLSILTTNGNVGIGTTSPSHALHVSGSGAQKIKVESTDNEAAIELASDSSGPWVMYSANGSDDLRWYGNSAVRMALTSAGNLGIGDTTPSYKLDVNGTGRFTGDLLGNSRIRVDKGAGEVEMSSTDGVFIQEEFIQTGSSANTPVYDNINLNLSAFVSRGNRVTTSGSGTNSAQAIGGKYYLFNVVLHGDGSVQDHFQSFDATVYVGGDDHNVVHRKTIHVLYNGASTDMIYQYSNVMENNSHFDVGVEYSLGNSTVVGAASNNIHVARVYIQLADPSSFSPNKYNANQLDWSWDFVGLKDEAHVG